MTLGQREKDSNMREILLICLFFCHQLHAVTSKTKIPIVTIGVVQQEILEKTLLYPVIINSETESKIQADNKYIIIKKLVKLGQKVKKGTPLLVLRNQDLSIHYENRTLRSPVEGVVAHISVQAGQFVRAGEQLVHINDPSKLVGKIEISPTDYKKIKVGLPSKLSFRSINKKDIKASLSSIGSTIDGITGTVSAEIEISPKAMKQLIPGIIGHAEVTLKKEQLVLVKEKSLYYIGDDIFLATLDKSNRVKKVKVKLGQRVKDRIEIVSGVPLNQKYVAESTRFLRDNEEVQSSEKK